MSDIRYDYGQTASVEEIRNYVMGKAKIALGRKTNFGFRARDGDAELWVETDNPNTTTSVYWHIFDNKSRVMGWRLMIFKCPIGYIEVFKKSRGITDVYSLESPSTSTA